MSLLVLHIMCLSFGQLAKIISFPPSSTVGDMSVFYSVCIQIEVNGTFPAISGLVFHHEKLLTVKFIANSFASS